MKKLLTILAVIALASPAAAQLVITGVVDGPLSGGLPKAVEITVCGDVADLSAFGIGAANNGGGTDGVEFYFPAGSASAGDVLYASQEEDGFTTFFGFAPDLVVGSAVGVNGDDAIELFDVSGAEPVVIDVFGDIDVDGSGTPWDYLDGWVKRNTQTGPDGDVFVLENWTFSGIDALDGETENASAANPFPMDGYECDPNAVSSEEDSWDGIKSLYR